MAAVGDVSATGHARGGRHKSSQAVDRGGWARDRRGKKTEADASRRSYECARNGARTVRDVQTTRHGEEPMSGLHGCPWGQPVTPTNDFLGSQNRTKPNLVEPMQSWSEQARVRLEANASSVEPAPSWSRNAQAPTTQTWPKPTQGQWNPATHWPNPIHTWSNSTRCWRKSAQTWWKPAQTGGLVPIRPIRWPTSACTAMNCAGRGPWRGHPARGRGLEEAMLARVVGAPSGKPASPQQRHGRAAIGPANARPIRAPRQRPLGATLRRCTAGRSRWGPHGLRNDDWPLERPPHVGAPNAPPSTPATM